MDISLGGRRGQLALLLAVVGLIVGLVVTVPAVNAQEGDSGDAGIVLLSTAPGNNSIAYYANPVVPGPSESFTDVNPTPTATQTLNVSNKCTVETDNSILALTGAGGRRIAMVSNGLGVGTKNNCSTSEGRIGSGQTLTFALNSSMFDGVFIEQVEVDVEAKFQTDLGYRIDNDPTPRVHDLTKAQDNGPDAGVGDNEIAVIGQDEVQTLFSSITFNPTASGGELSIEGGGDGIVDGGELRALYKVNQTLFQLSTIPFEGELNCGDVSTGTAAPNPDGPADAVTLWRGENKDGSECVLLPYTLQIQDDVVHFDADFDLQPAASFLIRIDWDPTSPMVDPFNPPDREIDVEIDGTFVPVVACDGRTAAGSDPTADPAIDDTFVHPDGVQWCLAGEKLVLLANGSWQQIQWFHGGEDPNWR